MQLGLSVVTRVVPALMAGFLVLAAGPLSAQQIELKGVTGGGLNTFQPGRWGLVKARVANEGETDRSLGVAFWFDAQPSYQFMRETWVPARSQRRVVWPARLSERHEFGEAAEGQVRALPLGEAGDRPKFDESTALLTPIRGRYPTAVIRDGGGSEADRGVLAVRQAKGLAERLIYPPDIAESMPRYTLGWEPIDVLVLADLSQQPDPGHRRALRRWLRAGGTVWVMADRLPGDIARRLFDEAWDVAEVGRVGFNRLSIRTAEGDASYAPGDRLASAEAEEPFGMVRLTPGGFTVRAECRDWPALMTRQVGRGRLVVTTIDWRTIVGEGRGAWREAIGDAVYPMFAVTGGQAAARPAMAPQVTDPYVRRHIAYRIADRWLVGGVLIALLALMAVTGVWLTARRRGEWAVVAWLVLIAVASLALLGIGMNARSQVGHTNAQLQVVHAEPGSVAATVEGAIGLFASPRTRQAELTSRAGGWAWPRHPGAATGGVVRLRWADLDHWRWQQLTVQGGTLRMLAYQTPIDLPESPRLSIRFDERGLSGQLGWPNSEAPTDLVLVTARGAIEVSQRAGGQSKALSAPADAVLPEGAFYAGAVLTDTQRHRNETLVAMGEVGGWPDEPVLAAWSDRIDAGLSDEADVAWRGGALWLMPVRFDRPEVGERVTVPWPLVRHEAVKSAPGVQPARSLFDLRQRTWVPTRQPATVVHRFIWPEAASPLAIEAATLLVDIEAPGRTVRILGFDESGPIELARRDSPDGRWRVELPIDRLSDGPRGSMMLGVDVGELPSRRLQQRVSLSSNWQLERLGLEVRGRSVADDEGDDGG